MDCDAIFRASRDYLQTHYWAIFLEGLLGMRDLAIDWRYSIQKVRVEDEYFHEKGFLTTEFDSLLRRVNRLQLCFDTSRNFCLDSFSTRLRELPPSFRKFLVICQTVQSPSEDLSVDAYDAVAAAVVLLSLVFLYLTGHAARGSSIPYSSGSLDFRDTYIPIILFHGAYVWIKSRDVAFRGVLPKKSRDKDGNIRVRYEPRFKPSHPKDEPSRYIYVGRYDTPEEAYIVNQITAFCYNGRGGLLQLEDGNSLTIQSMTDSDRRLTGAEKRKCVAAQVRRVYEAFKAERANAAQPRELPAVVVDNPNSVSLNPADATHGAHLPVSPTNNSESGSAPCGSHGLDSLCEMCIAGLGFSPGDGVDAVDSQAFRDVNNFQEGVAACITHNGTSYSSENELALLRILVSSQQEVISLRRQVQEFSEARHQHYIEQQQRDIEHQQRDIELQQLKAELTELRNHRCFQPLEPQEFSIQHFQTFQDQLQDLFIDQGMPTSQASVDHSSNDLFRCFMNA